MLRLVVMVCALSVLGTAASPVPGPEVEQARALAREVLAGTHAQLTQAVGESGPAGALEACGAATLQAAAAHAGWRVRRVSLRPRAAADEPDAYERDVLEVFERMERRGILRPQTEHVGVAMLEGRPVLRYLKPVSAVGGMCLQCHGSRASIPAEVQAALRARYPRDRATGRRVGELMGALSVTVPIEHPQE